jgi:glycosyltransferase involved in cell wall biosynthesis
MLAALRLTGAKVHYVVHDPLPHVWKLPRRLRFFENIGYRATYALSSSLIVLSETGKSVLKHNYRLASKPIAVIEHGVFALDTAPCAPGEQRLLLFGTLRRNKSIREAMEAVVAARARGSRATLTVAGSIDGTEPDYWPMCEPIALAHPDAITLEIGYVEQSRLSVLVNECDAFLLPYRDFHSQSGVAMLAASNARTLIASRAGGIGELIADGMAAVAIELPVGTAEITDAILAFEAEPITKWNARALAYREKTMSSRAWEVIGANYIKVSRGGAA